MTTSFFGDSPESTSIVNIGHGDPTVFRAWWIKNNLLPFVFTKDPAMYEYQEDEHSELVRLTHSFHRLFGTDCGDASIVYGNGSTQIINAILYTLSRKLGRCIVVGYKTPVYMLMHEFLSHCTWVKVTFDLTRSDIDVEIVIDPNNPSGDQRKKLSQAPYTIYDKAYNWPIYVDSVTPTSSAASDITVYTISKCLGMGGLRLGWAFINDIELSYAVKRSLYLIGICPNSFGMEAAKSVFEKFLCDPALLQSYVEDISETIEMRRKSIKDNPHFTVTNTSGPYAWIKSKNGENIRSLLLDKFGIEVYSGSEFGDTDDHARMSLICSNEEFSQAIERLQNTG